MAQVVETRAIARVEMLERVVHELKEAGVPRLTVTRVHAIGAGADPATKKLSLDEGSAYADKAMIQFICGGDRCEMYSELICRVACTGRRGDGVVSVHPVHSVMKIRTCAKGLEALK